MEALDRAPLPGEANEALDRMEDHLQAVFRELRRDAGRALRRAGSPDAALREVGALLDAPLEV